MNGFKKHFWAVLLFVVFCFVTAHPAISQAGAADQGSAAQHSAGKVSSAAAPQQESGDDVYRHSPSVRMLARMMHMDQEHAARLFEYLNFAVLAGAVLFALLRILPKSFREKRETIQRDLIEARTATAQANERLAAIEQRLGRLDEEISGISKQAEKDVLEDEARIKTSIEVERERILKSIDTEIAAATSTAQRELRQFAAGLAVDRAAQKLTLTPEDDRALLHEFAQSLGQKKPGRGDNN